MEQLMSHLIGKLILETWLSRDIKLDRRVNKTK